VIRQIEEADRQEYAHRIASAEARGELDEAQAWRKAFADWEREQGQERERLVCPICGSIWLAPTAKGTSRPHRRYDISAASWDRVRELRADIQTLQAELDRLLDELEP